MPTFSSEGSLMPSKSTSPAARRLSRPPPGGGGQQALEAVGGGDGEDAAFFGKLVHRYDCGALLVRRDFRAFAFELAIDRRRGRGKMCAAIPIGEFVHVE